MKTHKGNDFWAWYEVRNTLVKRLWFRAHSRLSNEVMYILQQRLDGPLHVRVTSRVGRLTRSHLYTIYGNQDE
jgi:hypothetical protein